MIRFLHSKDIWPRITALAKRTKKSLVAVAYLGQGASSLLPLRKGSVLVVDASQKTVKAGGTSPHELITLLNKHVEVNSCSNLHAKVFVFGNRAIIGSNNASSNSKSYYLEAAIETTDPKAVQACREFVLGLRGDFVNKEYAHELKKLWNPPKRRGIKRPDIPRFHTLWVVPLTIDDWDETDKRHDKVAEPVARSKIKNKRKYKLEKFQWEGGALLAEGNKGHQIIQAIEAGKERKYYPPSRIVHIRRYVKKGAPQAIYYLEVPKVKPYMRSQATVFAALDKWDKRLELKHSAIRIRNPIISRVLYQLWPSDV